MYTIKVSEMQQELRDLQPELIKTSEETEVLMTKIEKDTVEAEAKKEVHCTTSTVYTCTMCIVQLHVHVPLLSTCTCICNSHVHVLHVHVYIAQLHN